MTDEERALAIYDKVMASAQVTTHFEVFGLDWLPETIAAALAAARADEREALVKQAEAYEASAADLGGCGDSCCAVIRPKGVHTNGGCRCLRYPEDLDQHKLRLLRRQLSLGQSLAAAIRSRT